MFCDSEDRFSSGFWTGFFIAGTLSAVAVFLNTKPGKKFQKDALNTFCDLEKAAENFVAPKKKKPSRPKKKKLK